MRILEHLYQRVSNNPDDICLMSPDTSFTFKQLDIYSDEIAKIITEKTSKDIVPLFIKNDILILPAVLGIIKLGKIPLPLTTSLSFEQSITRIQEVDYDLILSDEQFLDTNNIRLENVAILTVPQPFFGNQLHTIDYEVVQKSNTAYIICTSGSTGIPKKVFLSQQNISWLLEEFYSLVDFGKDSIFLFTTPYTFDVSLTELFSPIFTGGKLCCFSEDLQNVEKMKSTLEYVQKYNITHMSLSPTYADLLVDISPLNMFKGLKYLCLGGEVFGIQLANKLSDIIDQGTCVLNLYGPSETTVYATYYKVTGKEKLEVPIGKPLSGCELKIINKEDNDKKSGELYIGGNGVALGYLLDKELSEKKFIQFNSKPYYKTGDFVHFNDKDELIFENRKDNQVQVNGIRVEIGEIENQVIKFKEIKHCKVVYEGRRIYIFYQVFSRENKLKEKIKKSIPKYLNPILIEVPEFLVNQNRKFDSKRMIEKYFIKASLGENGMIRAEVEEILKKLEIISYEDMDSLDTVRFFIEIEERFQLEIAEELISSLLNIEQVVEFLENKERNITKNKPLEEKTDNKICTFNEINIELMLKNYLREEDLEDNLIPTLFMQKQYALKKYNAVLSLDFKYNDFSFEGIKNIQNTIERVARKIDILRMILIEERGNLYFKKIKADKFVPVIALMNSSLQESDAKNILYNSSNSQQFFATVCPNKELLTLYFSHNIIDKSSLFKLSKIFKAFLNKQDVQISNKTYEDFIGFTKKRNKSVEIDDILPMLPDTDSFLPLLREHIDNRVLLFESRRHSREAIEVTSEAVYKLAQYIFNIDKDMQVLTGSFIADARIFNNFDATEIIGDIHSNIPFEIHKNQKFQDLNFEIGKSLNVYRDGLNIRDKIFDGYPMFLGNYQVAKEKLEKLNFSFNYIGEVKDIKNTLQSIIKAKFTQKYIIIFTKKEKLYMAIFDDRLLPSDFTIDSFEESEIIKVRDYVKET